MQDTTDDGQVPTDERASGSASCGKSRWVRPVAFGAAGLLAGGLLAGSITASADESAASNASTGTSTTAPGLPGGPPVDQSQP